MILFSLDPGLHGCGVALFRDGVLIAAGYVTSSTWAGQQRDAYAWMCMGQEVRHWLDVHRPAECYPDVMAVEVPVMYQRSQKNVDVDDLMQLCGVDGACVAAVGANRVISYHPAEWKGQVPKDIYNARTLKALTGKEQLAIEWPSKSLRHNVLDAIGIGRKAINQLRDP